MFRKTCLAVSAVVVLSGAMVSLGVAHAAVRNSRTPGTTHRATQPVAVSFNTATDAVINVVGR